MTDVAIIGGGAIGLAIAWQAAGRGMAVTVIDPAPASGASRVAAGMLAPAGEAQFGEERLLALALESWRRYPEFVAELEEAAGRATGYSRCGALVVARDGDEHAALERELAFRAGLGLGVRRLTSRECRRLEPRLAPGIRGGVLSEGDHQVDPRALLAALLEACSRAGVTVIRDRVVALSSEGGRAAGVRLGDGAEIRAASVVLAAGSWSADVAGVPPGARPAVRPVKGQILRLHGAVEAPLAHRIVRGRDVYVVPRANGEVVVGATMEERGFDTTVTAGAVHDMLRDARELLPDVAELELVEASAGLRPGSPDNAPLLGETALRGLVVATGHHRNGILLTPISADAISALLAGDAPPEVAAPFSPARFETGAAVVA